MANIEKPKFHILEVSRNNYLSWCLDMEMHLQGQDLANTITEDGTSNAKDKANALIFIRRHLHESLQTQYLSVRDPQTLWKRLKDRYDHTKTVILPQAQYDWQNLRVQDFKSVSDYNSALFDIVSQLELCGIKLTDAELLEKTFSTFYASNIVLQQQYRQRQFATYSDLISVSSLLSKLMNCCSKIMILERLAQKHCLKHMQTLRKLLVILKATSAGKNIILEGVAENLTALGNLTLARIMTKKRSQRR